MSLLHLVVWQNVFGHLWTIIKCSKWVGGGGGGNRDGGFFLTRFWDGVGVRSEILKPMMNMNRRVANENLIAIILSLYGIV